MNNGATDMDAPTLRLARLERTEGERLVALEERVEALVYQIRTQSEGHAKALAELTSSLRAVEHRLIAIGTLITGAAGFTGAAVSLLGG